MAVYHQIVGSNPTWGEKLPVHSCGQPESAALPKRRSSCQVRLPVLSSRGDTQAHAPAQVHAALIVVLTRGGSTARLVAKYRPSIPVLTVAVPVLTTDALTWTCSGESPARQCLITRGLIPLLAEGSARATDTDTTDEILAVSTCLDCSRTACMLHHQRPTGVSSCKHWQTAHGFAAGSETTPGRM